MRNWKRRLQITVVMCVLLAGSAIAASGQEPGSTAATFTPTVRALFESFFDGTGTPGSDLFTTDLHADGVGPVRQLTDTVEEEILGLPAWAPDGTRFASMGHHRTSEGHLGLAVVDSFGNLQSFAHGVPVDTFTWSPDGERLVMSEWTRVWTAALDGSNVREVFTVPAFGQWEGALPERARVTFLNWAPSGSGLFVPVFVGSETGQGSASWIVDVDSGDATRVDLRDLGWRSDGDAFVAVEKGSGDVVVAPTDTPRQTTLRVHVPEGHVHGLPMWSPFDARVAFTRYPADPDGGEVTSTQVVVAHVATGDTQVFEVDACVGLRLWAPDGQSLVGVEAGRREQSFVCPREDETRLGRLDLGTGEWARTDVNFEPHAWVPDSDAIAGVFEQTSGHNTVRRDAGVLGADGTVNVAQDSRFAGYRGPVVSPAGLGKTVRAMGRDRVETAIDLSRGTFETADAVVLARSDSYPDALAGAPLAHEAGGPLLLTSPDGLDSRVRGEIVRLGVERATILGTDDALAPRVADDLRDLGVAVERIGGRDRFETAALVADRLDTTDVFLVEGIHPDPSRGWPDAVAVSGLAAATGRPILLTARDHLPKGTATWLGAHQPEKVKIIGSPAAVSRRVASEVDDLAGDVVRHGGVDRYDTSKLIANLSVKAGIDPATTLIVTGRNWPDALAAAPVAAATGGVLVLTSPTRPDDVRTAVFLDMHHDDIDRAVLVGGLAALPAETQRFLHHQLR